MDYQEIPWRNGRFDPTSLSNKLATWAAPATPCGMAGKGPGPHPRLLRLYRPRGLHGRALFREGIRAAAVYAGSSLDRGAALELLEGGGLQVIFSVDLFNEGVDLPPSTPS